MRLLARAATTAVAAVLVAGCTASSGGVAASVAGTEIPRDRVEDAVRELVGDTESLTPEQRGSRAGAAQRQVLSFLIQAEVLELVGDEQGVEVTDEEVDAARQELLDSIGGEEQLDMALLQSGLTRDLFEEVLVPQQALLTALRRQIAGDAVEMRTVRHILVESEDEALEIVAELESGADFAELASERSVDTGSGAEGGDLGAAPRGAYVTAFEEAVWSAEVGELVGPVESEFGFHVLEVTDASTVAPDELTERQTSQVVGEQFAQLLDDAFQRAEISIGDGLGTWDEAQRVVRPGDRAGEGRSGAGGMPPLP